MENDNSQLLPKDLPSEIIKHASYFILHRHFENKKCLRHAEPTCVDIKSQQCSAKNNPSLQNDFKEPRNVPVFYNQDKQPLLENILVFTPKEYSKGHLLNMAREMLDPNVKPRAIYGTNLGGSMPPIFHLYDKDNDLLMAFLGFTEPVEVPLTQAQKQDLSRFVELADDFSIRVPEEKGCCNVI